MDRTLKDQAVIVGIGQTDFSKNSGRSELQLAAECTKAAIADAGLAPSDIDGMTGFTLDSTDEIELARTVGCGDLTFFSRMGYGGGAAVGIVHQAAMAVATGAANPPCAQPNDPNSTQANARRLDRRAPDIRRPR